MKYVLMFTNRPDLDAAVPAEQMQQTYAAMFAWFEKYGSVIVNQGAELTPPETATSVKTGEDGSAVVVDGPFSEAKEVIGGFALLQADSLEEAIEMGRRFIAVAGDGECEIRQLYEEGDFDAPCVAHTELHASAAG